MLKTVKVAGASARPRWAGACEKLDDTCLNLKAVKKRLVSTICVHDKVRETT
jgi:hypothetical protein